jgi:hypothetical protein
MMDSERLREALTAKLGAESSAEVDSMVFLWEDSVKVQSLIEGIGFGSEPEELLAQAILELEVLERDLALLYSDSAKRAWSNLAHESWSSQQDQVDFAAELITGWWPDTSTLGSGAAIIVALRELAKAGALGLSELGLSALKERPAEEVQHELLTVSKELAKSAAQLEELLGRSRGRP